MFDENDRSSHPDDTSRHIRRGARHEDDKTIEGTARHSLRRRCPSPSLRRPNRPGTIPPPARHRSLPGSTR